MVAIDYKDARPIYEQVVAGFEKLVLNGALAADTKMPSVRSLAMELSINPNTIQKAYNELERMGIIYTVKGKGSFVSNCSDLAKLQKQTCLDKLKAYVAKAKSLGIEDEEMINIVKETKKE